MKIYVKVKPGAREDSIEEISDGEFRVEVKALARDGKANERVRKILAREFGVGVDKVKLKTFSGRKKVIEIIGL